MPYRESCERCSRPLSGLDEAYICSYECTFCPDCLPGPDRTCPNCGGESVRRPRRKAAQGSPAATIETAPVSSRAKRSRRPGARPGRGDVPSSSAERVTIDLVTRNNIPRIVPLFDEYRKFYRQASDPRACETFLTDRADRRESLVFEAAEDGAAVGFVQLYPSFSSISLKPIWVLNDLFVAPRHRRHGIASLLLERSQELARESGADRVLLETAVDNPAQKLYELRGWLRDTEFLHYEWMRPAT